MEISKVVFLDALTEHDLAEEINRFIKKDCADFTVANIHFLEKKFHYAAFLYLEKKAFTS